MNTPIVDSDDPIYLLELLTAKGSEGIVRFESSNRDYRYMLANKYIKPWVSTDALKSIADNVPPDVFRFWFNTTYDKVFISNVWVIVTEEYAKKNLNTYNIYFCHPQLLYSSKRMKADMAMFRTPFSQTKLTYDVHVPMKETTYVSTDVALPVTRYSDSVETGLYHAKKKH